MTDKSNPGPTDETGKPSNETMGTAKPAYDPMWYERPETGKTLVIGLLALGLLFLVIGFAFQSDSKIALAKIPAFYPLVALVSVAVLVVLARTLRALFELPEDTYDR